MDNWNIRPLLTEEEAEELKADLVETLRQSTQKKIDEVKAVVAEQDQFIPLIEIEEEQKVLRSQLDLFIFQRKTGMPF